MHKSLIDLSYQYINVQKGGKFCSWIIKPANKAKTVDVKPVVTVINRKRKRKKKNKKKKLRNQIYIHITKKSIQ